MFLKLLTHEGIIVYVNINEIRKFEKCKYNPNLTAIDLQYGSMLVQQKPEEIMKMIEGSD